MTRWFTTQSSAPDQPSDWHFTPLEEEAVAAIKAFEAEQNSRNELMYCLDASGSRIIDITSGMREAPLSRKMRDAMEAGSALRLWHNHPSNDSLSAEDWKVASVSPDIEVVALTSTGSTFVGRVPDWDDRLEIAFKHIPQIAGFAQIEVLKANKGYPHTALDNLVGHLIGCELASRKLLRYAHRLSARDQAVLREALAIGHLSVVKGEISSAFEKRLNA